MQHSAPGVHQENGIIEKAIDTVKLMARTMMDYCQIPARFWALALNATCHTLNLLPHSSDGQTAYQRNPHSVGSRLVCTVMQAADMSSEYLDDSVVLLGALRMSGDLLQHPMDCAYCLLESTIQMARSSPQETQYLGGFLGQHFSFVQAEPQLCKRGKTSIVIIV